jgi:pilus assembly protein CpaE
MEERRIMGIRILAVDDNAINLKVVSITLQHAGYEVYTAQNGPQALELIDSIHPDVILLDITMPDMDGYEVCRRIRSNPATTHIAIMMLTAHDTLEEKIKGFESGADDYLIKPFQPAELQARIKVLSRRTPLLPGKSETAKTPGKVIAVFSLRGGVGVSTIATNLACGLAQIWGKQTALVDLSLTLGQSALMLNLSLRNTWADLAKISIEELDQDVVSNVLINHPSGVSVLAAPRSAADGELVTPDMVKKVIGILKTQFNYIILDLPHDFRETVLAGLDLAEDKVVLLAPELAGVRAMGAALEVFDKLGYARERVIMALNWTFEKRGLARKDIENVLHQSIRLVIPFASEALVSAINLGSPPVYSAPTSPVGALFEDFAFSLSREEELKQQPAEPTDAWLRVQERAGNRVSARR